MWTARKKHFSVFRRSAPDHHSDAVKERRNGLTNFLGAQIRKEHIAPVRKEQITTDKTKADTAFSGRHILELPE
jgi:hypothetical protein